MAITFQFNLNSNMFVPLIVLIALLMLFIRQGYKYRDTRSLFFGFVCLTLSAFFSFIQPIAVLPGMTSRIISHSFAAATGWLLWMDTKHMVEVQEAKK
jgi:hypothetical protein